MGIGKSQGMQDLLLNSTQVMCLFHRVTGIRRIQLVFKLKYMKNGKTDGSQYYK